MEKIGGKTFGFSLSHQYFDGLHVTHAVFQPNFSIPPHEHAYPTLQLLYRGNMTVSTQGAEMTPPPFSLIYDPAPIACSVNIHEEGMGCVWVEMTPEWLGEQHAEEMSMMRAHFSTGVDSKIKILRMLALIQANSSKSDIRNEVLELLTHFDSKQPPTASEPYWLHRAEIYIEDYFSGPISLSSIAAEIGVHPIHLARVFRRKHGLSVGEFLLRKRVIHAADLLLKRGASISEASYQSGFHDASHLTKSLGKLNAASPSQIRSLEKMFRSYINQEVALA